MLEAYEYCARKLADLASTDQLGEIDAYAFDGLERQSLRPDDHLNPITLLVQPRFAASCADLLDLIATEQASAELHRQLSEHGYNIPPYGSGSMFGYWGPTAAWCLLDQNGPALIFREDDTDLAPYINKWFTYWLTYPTPRFTWPTANKINDAIELPKFPEYSRAELTNEILKGYHGRSLRAIRRALKGR